MEVWIGVLLFTVQAWFFMKTGAAIQADNLPEMWFCLVCAVVFGASAVTYVATTGR